MDFEKLKQKELCRALGVSVRTVQRWDCPRNEDGTYSLPEVFKWRLKKQVASGSPMAEINRISAENLAEWRGEKAKLAALERRRIEGELLEVHEICRIAEAAGCAVRESFESLAVRVAPLLAAQPDAFECQQILETEVHILLNGLENHFAWEEKNDGK